MSFLTYSGIFVFPSSFRRSQRYPLTCFLGGEIWHTDGTEEKHHRSTLPPLTEKYRTRRSCHLLLCRLWLACTKEQEACVFFNWKRISFKNRNKTEPVQWYVCVAVRENYGEKTMEKKKLKKMPVSSTQAAVLNPPATGLHAASLNSSFIPLNSGFI